MEMLDTRNSKPMKKYKGFAGTVKSISINQEKNTVASCSLDRFLRIHNIGDATLQNKVYLKSRLNCLLYSKHEPVCNEKKNKDIGDDIEDDLLSEINSEDLGTDSLWSDIETMAEEHPSVFKDKKKRKNESFNDDMFKKPR
jgi:ribosome biogenesis protein NSA1